MPHTKNLLKEKAYCVDRLLESKCIVFHVLLYHSGSVKPSLFILTQQLTFLNERTKAQGEKMNKVFQ